MLRVAPHAGRGGEADAVCPREPPKFRTYLYTALYEERAGAYRLTQAASKQRMRYRIADMGRPL